MARLVVNFKIEPGQITLVYKFFCLEITPKLGANQSQTHAEMFNNLASERTWNFSKFEYNDEKQFEVFFDQALYSYSLTLYGYLWWPETLQN